MLAKTVQRTLGQPAGLNFDFVNQLFAPCFRLPWEALSLGKAVHKNARFSELVSK